MAITPVDVHNDKDILSMMDLLALAEITPPERCYPNALLNKFDSQLDFGDTKSSMEERSRRETTLMAIAAAHRAPLSRSREGHEAQHEATPSALSDMYPPAGFVLETMLVPLPPSNEGIIPSLPNNKGPERSVSFKGSLSDLSDSDIVDSPKIPPESHYEIHPPKCARAFQSPFKLCASRTSAREAHDKKDNTINSSKKKKRDDELFIPNALETDNHFKVACLVATLLLLFHDKDFKGKKTRGKASEECNKYRPAPLSDMWLNILLKQAAEKLIIDLHTILTQQEVRPSAMGGVPSFLQSTFITGTLMDKFHQGHWACRAELPPTVEEKKSHFMFYHLLSCDLKQATYP
jgi:hypothetical protein